MHNQPGDTSKLIAYANDFTAARAPIFFNTCKVKITLSEKKHLRAAIGSV